MSATPVPFFPLCQRFIVGALIVAILGPPGPAAAQARATGDDDQAYLEALRREDAIAAERYVVLRDARAQALTDMRKVEVQFNNANPQVRGLFVSSLRQARRKYAEASLALLEFFDARDRMNIGRYQDEIVKLNGLIEDRKRTRAELEKLLAP